ncbi:unannotated protein [freshwater metagenome]|uniref:Unannotated protein n=1 Tax=freshwater metagenome TaxID=449393 RepID=A0A6J6DJ35_9ZZZZ
MTSRSISNSSLSMTLDVIMSHITLTAMARSLSRTFA